MTTDIFAHSSLWPLVDPKDDGIRPAGPPDACLYCRCKVGQPHGRECVCVTKRIEMRVLAWFGGTRRVIGLWQLDQPYSWDARMSEFHKNRSSWCASNFLDESDVGSVQWLYDHDQMWESLRIRNEAEGGCLCAVLYFEFARVVDSTPKRSIRE